MRKLVTIRTISAIDPIPNADAIEVATVDGWKVVVKKGEFAVGQNVLYFEIDSILPKGNPAFEFLMARGCKLQPTEDVSIKIEGHRLRTIKLRGQISQGLILPLPGDWEIVNDKDVNYVETFMQEEALVIDDDFSTLFGVKKYEKPIPTSLQGKIRGNYPAWLPKTDQERVQNCFNEIPPGLTWTIEEKVEGSSITIYHDGLTAGVTSRNIDLKLDQEGNTFVDVAKASGLINLLESVGLENYRVAIRGELVGPGIQDNIYGLNDYRIYIYDIWVNDGYITPYHRAGWMNDIFNSEVVDPRIVFAVPVVAKAAFTDTQTLDDIILGADGASLINPKVLREGVVYKAETDENVMYSFKAISNQYLLKEKE